MDRTTSGKLFEEASKHIPGGVNSPVRAFKGVGGTPVFFASAKGAYLFDVDGNTYIDYIGSWGPMILGHAYEPVIRAITEIAPFSTSFGAPTEHETEIAILIKSMVPNIDLVRMVNSGTEACMAAIRLARGFTGKNKIIKFEGCYHGHADSFLIKAGSGASTLGIPNSPGITPQTASDTLTAKYNDLENIEALVRANPGSIAALIVEPVAGNMGCVPPLPGFLEGLRSICTREGIVLIFDEVMTGFRLARGGAQERFGIQADLVTFGKIIGAGLPVGAYGGRKEIMEKIAPLGPVYQAGTLSGNPLAMVAGYTLLKTLYENPAIYNELDEKCDYLANGLKNVLDAKGIPYQLNHLGSMISLHFTEISVTDFATAASGDNHYFRQYFHGMLDRGVYLPPSAYETWFLSQAHTTTELDKTIEATETIIRDF